MILAHLIDNFGGGRAGTLWLGALLWIFG